MDYATAQRNYQEVMNLIQEVFISLNINLKLFINFIIYQIFRQKKNVKLLNQNINQNNIM